MSGKCHKGGLDRLMIGDQSVADATSVSVNDIN